MIRLIANHMMVFFWRDIKFQKFNQELNLFMKLVSTKSCSSPKARDPKAQRQVRQNIGSRMFMVRFQTLSARDCH